jgi:Zn-dependent protease
VPVNPFRFRNPVVGMLLTAAAGPLSNLLLAFLFAVILGLAERAGDMTGNAGFLMLFRFVTLNLGLAIFNLLPVPPLDGSSVLAAAMTERARTAYLNIGGAGIFVILILQGTGMLRRILGPPIEFLFGLAMDVASFARG